MFPLGIITSFIGVNIRYLAYRLIGKPKTKKQLKATDKDALSQADQHFVNSTIGFIVLSIILVIFHLL